MEIELRGLDKFLSCLDEAILRFEEKANEGLMEIAKEIERLAKEFVRVRTDALKDSITAEQRDRLEAVVKALFYGFFLEYGTVKMPPYPFIQPALERIRPHIDEITWKHLGELFRR